MPSLELKEYGVCFGSKVILDDITIRLPNNGVSVLMGPVGAGKSTLLYSLAGINNNNSRFREWGGADLNGQRIDQAHHPVLVRQQISLLSETVENAILRQAKFSGVNISNRQEFVSHQLMQFGASNLLGKLNQSLIDIDPVSQRMALIVGAAASNSALLMLDEPTSDLNSHDAELMIKFIRHLGEKLKLIVVLHNQAQARELADDIILLAGGRVQFQGAAVEFFGKTPPNDSVKQFVQTGSVSIAVPDARREYFGDDTTPLPPTAIDAIQSFSSPITLPHPSNVTAKNETSVTDLSKTITDFDLEKKQEAKDRAAKIQIAKESEAQGQAAKEHAKLEIAAQERLVVEKHLAEQAVHEREPALQLQEQNESEKSPAWWWGLVTHDMDKNANNDNFQALVQKLTPTTQA